MKFYGQQGEDKIVQAYFKTQSNGFYIDVGAYDGIRFSNTLLLEELGWDGICVEPNPTTFAKLKQNRKCICLNVLAGERVSPDELFCISGVSMTSYRPMITRDGPAKFIELPVIKRYMLTLDFIIGILGIQSVDFLSIDAEGYDVEVLLGASKLLGNLKPKIILVEETQALVKPILEGNFGYAYSRQHYFNWFYCRDKDVFDAIKDIDPRMENGQDVRSG